DTVTASSLRERARQALASIVAPLDAVYASLEKTRLAVLDQHTLVRASGRRLRRSDLGSLRPLLLEHLATHDPLMAGTGVIFALEVLEDTPRWLEWHWRAAPGAAPTFLSVG